MLNHIVLMGRLTRDPELRRTSAGIAVTSFRIAVDRDFGGNRETGEKETDYIDVVAWRQTGEFVNKYFSKGRMVVVSGRLQMRSWNDKDGNKRTTAEVVADNVYFGDSKRDGDSNGSSYAGGTSYAGGGYSGGSGYNGSNNSNARPYGSAPAPADSSVSDFGTMDENDGDLPF